MASVQQAREALGGSLREVRRRSNLTGATLADRLGWAHSKISKLENGRQTPTDADIRAWCAACGPEGAAELQGLLSSLHTLEARHAEWRRLLAGGARGHQDEIGRLYAKTRLFRNFETTIVPGLLQTGNYARAILAEVISSFGLPNDIDEAVAARMARQQVLYDSAKRFHFVITEAVLRYRYCPLDVMLAQLDRLVSATALPNVRLGVIGFRTMYTRVPDHGFHILDDRLVQAETVSAELNLAQPQEIETYEATFKRFASLASYGAEARAIITGVMRELGAELEAGQSGDGGQPDAARGESEPPG